MAVTPLGPGALTVPNPHHPRPVDGVAPPGWEKTITKMKKSDKIENPWALAWYMKNRGAHPATHEEDARYDAVIASALAELQGREMPALCLAAAHGETTAMTRILQGGALVLEARW